MFLSPVTSLVGRERQASQAAVLLLCPSVRLLTLTGPGGAGKTRMAIAEQVADRFSAGGHFAGVASITNHELVASAPAEAFEIQPVAKRTLPELIGDQLRNDSTCASSIACSHPRASAVIRCLEFDMVKGICA